MLLVNASVSLHLFLISSRGRRKCYLGVFALAIVFIVFLLWYSTCPILWEDYCKGSLMFITIIIITVLIINCILLLAVPKCDCRSVWRRSRFFISSVEDSVLERSAALESLCFGIGFGRLGSLLLYYCVMFVK